MKKRLILPVFIVLAAAVFYCAAKADEQASDTADVKLAEAIMMAPPYTFNFERDPFGPITEGARAETEDICVEEAPAVVFDDVPRLHGIVSSGGVPRALLQIRDKTRLYKAGELVGSYLIESIEAKRIILKRGENQVELKVGGS